MDAKRLRPHPHLLRRGVGATLAFFVPAFGVLLFLTVPHGPWPAVLVGQLLVAVALGWSILSYLRLSIEVDAAGVTERGFFVRRTHVPVADIGTIVFVNTFHGGGIDMQPQLFVTDAAGRQLIRMRGQFWSRDSMTTVIDTLDVPLTQIDHPVSTGELHATYPGLLYWFERRPVVAALTFAGILVAGGAVLYLLLMLVGAAG